MVLISKAIQVETPTILPQGSSIQTMGNLQITQTTAGITISAAKKQLDSAPQTLNLTGGGPQQLSPNFKPQTFSKDWSLQPPSGGQITLTNGKETVTFDTTTGERSPAAK